jgi:hypothetical protein
LTIEKMWAGSVCSSVFKISKTQLRMRPGFP